MSQDITTLADSVDDPNQYALDLCEMVLLAGGCFALGMWIGLEYAWRASFAIDRAVLGSLPEVVMYTAFLLFVAMGFVGLYAEQSRD